MLNSLFNLQDGSAPSIILSIALMLFLGFMTTRITKLMKLPNVTAYIIIGIIIGPFCLGIIPDSIIKGTDFLADIALALISFCIGEYFKVSSFRNNGLKSLIIAVLESVMSSAVVFVLTYFIFKFSFENKK
jgi:Kef-type K+ transport system membrane component KefB